MAVLWLVIELLSHAFFLVPIALAFYTGRGQIGMILIFLVAASMHYHVCLDGDVCLTSLNRAGSWDYAGGYYLGAVLVHTSSGIGHDTVSAHLTVILAELFLIVDDLYMNYWSFFLITATIFFQLPLNRLLYKMPTHSYSNPGITPLIMLTTVVSYILIALPLQPGGLWYNILHPPWHFTSALSITLLLLVITRPVIIEYEWKNGKLNIEYTYRSRSDMIREAINNVSYSELLPAA